MDTYCLRLIEIGATLVIGLIPFVRIGLATLTTLPPIFLRLSDRVAKVFVDFFDKLAWAAILIVVWKHLYGNLADFIRIRKETFLV